MKNSQKPTVAILLAAYNGQNYITEQIDSILKQENVNVYIYISIDKSTDRTLNICNEYASTNSCIHVLPYGLEFGGAAPNFFRLFLDTELSAYDYISLADQDDIWKPHKLECAINKMLINKVEAYSGNVMAFWSDGKELLIDKAQSQRKYDYLFEAAGPGCSYVFSQSLALNIQTFLKENSEVKDFILHDWLFYAYARSQGVKWYIDTVPMMHYRQHEENQVGVNNSFKSLWVRIKYVLLGGGLLQVKSLLQLLSDVNPQLQRWSPFGRKEIFNMLFKVNQFRRKPVERVYVFVALFIALILGVKDK